MIDPSVESMQKLHEMFPAIDRLTMLDNARWTGQDIYLARAMMAFLAAYLAMSKPARGEGE